ncbi:MAG: SemiSWEET transporter [Cyclobacteriaceae bacterium]
MNGIDYLGLFAGMLTTISFLPQAIKTWKTKSAKDLSLEMFLIFCMGVLLWLIYGMLLGNVPIILTNSLTIMLAGSILYFKLFRNG